MEKTNEIMLERAARIIKLDKTNASFEMKNSFLALVLREDGEEKRYDRVYLHRAFPHELLWEYISVSDGENKEIGLIYNIEDFDGEIAALLKTELERKYYCPTIKEISNLKERYGFSYWKVTTDEGDVSFTLHDTFRSIIHAEEKRLVILDVDGNRFEIPNVDGLDRKSYKKIELYL